MLPALAALSGIALYPLLYMLVVSFHTWGLVPGLMPRRFVGGSQYLWLVKSPDFWHWLRITFIFLGGALLFELSIGLGLALLLSPEKRWIETARILFLLPTTTAPVVIGLMWSYMLNRDMGIVNYFLGLINIAPVSWLSHPSTALLSVILVDVWQWTPFVMLILLAGLKSQPIEPLEAAIVDGATKWQTLKYVTLPLLMPIISVVIIFRALDTFKTIGLVYVMTGGGPGDATTIYGFAIYKKAFENMTMGVASALSVIMIMIVIGLVFIYSKTLQRRTRA
ncbi:Melibiose/raffinose/stachyose import permease protein MelD [subsurface metagenome]